VRDFRWHLISAGAGAAGLVAIVYLLTHGLADSPLASPFVHVALPRGGGAFYIPGPVVQGQYAQLLRLSAVGSAAAALMIAAAGVVTGCLCGWRNMSPAAPLTAGVPLFCLGLLSSWSHVSWGSLRPLAAPWGALNGIAAHVPLVLGGVLIAGALAPGRWTRTPATPSRKPWALGVLLGLIAIPVIGYLIEVTNTFMSGYVYWLPAVLRTSADAQRYVEPVLLIAALGSLAASRPLPRQAAVIAGAPMAAASVLGLLAPAAVASLFGWSAIPSSRIASSSLFPSNTVFGSFADPSWQDGLMFFAVSGLPLLYGGMLVAAGLSPDRWFRKEPALTGARPEKPAPHSDPRFRQAPPEAPSTTS
jgi:hypothetical protein